MTDFEHTIHFPRILVDFSNDTIWGDNRVLLSKHDVVADSSGNSIHLFEGLKIFTYEENIENNNFDNIIANGICIKNNTPDKTYCKWLMLIDENGLHYISEFE